MNPLNKARVRAERAVTHTPGFGMSINHIATMATLLRRMGIADYLSAPADIAMLRFYGSTHHLWKIAPWPDDPPAKVKALARSPDWPELVQGAHGGILSSLYIWGYLQKIATASPNAGITPKGWAVLVFYGLITPEQLLYVKQTAENRKDSFRLLDLMREDEADSAKGLAAGITAAPVPNTIVGFDNGIDFVLEEPVLSPEVARLIDERAKDHTQVALAQTALTKAWAGIEDGFDTTSKLVHNIVGYMTPVEILRADLALTNRADAFWRRVLVSRMSAKGAFEARTLGSVVGKRDPLLRGEQRIATAVEIGGLEQAGRAMGMNDGNTLGDVYERMTNESVSGMAEREEEREPLTWQPKPRQKVIVHGEIILTHIHGAGDRTLMILPVGGTADNEIVVPYEACEPGEDEWGRPIKDLPIVDWIEARVDANNVGGESNLIRGQDAKLIAREAALRTLRGKVNRYPLAIPNEVVTHRRAWMDALKYIHHVGAPGGKTEDSDNRSYWQHEIDVFDRTFDELAKLAQDTDIPGEEPGVMNPPPSRQHMNGATYYDGDKLHVVRNNMSLDGRDMEVHFIIPHDYDEDDTANVERLIDEAVSRFSDERRVSMSPILGAPYGGNVDVVQVGGVSTLKARTGVPWWLSILIGAAGGAAALGLFIAFLSALPVH